MSSSYLVYLYPKRKIKVGIEYPNSWGTAPVVWNCIAQKYIDPSIEHALSSDKVMKQIDNAWKNKEIPEYDRAVLMMVYYKTYVARRYYERAAKDIRCFLDEFPPKSGYVNHWPAIAEFYEGSPKMPGVGLWCTTVGENPFQEYDGCKEKYFTDWKRIHSFYEWLEELKDDRK